MIYELVVPASEQALCGQCIDPWDPAKHRPKESLFPLRTDTGRIILWELNRPKLDPLPTLDAGASKKVIISQLSNAMLNSKPGCPVTIEPPQNGSTDEKKQLDVGEVDFHRFHKENRNSLFYGMLLGLVELSLHSPGEVSVESLRKQLMDYLCEHPGELFGGKTLEEHAKERLRSRMPAAQTRVTECADHSAVATRPGVDHHNTDHRPMKRQATSGAGPSHAVQEDAPMKRQKRNLARSCSLKENADAACEFDNAAPDDLVTTTGGLHGEREEHEPPLQERSGDHCNGETLETPLDDDSGNVAVFALADYVDTMKKVDGSGCCNGDVLEMYLFAKVLDVNVALYNRGHGDSLVRTPETTLEAKSGVKRPWIHFLCSPSTDAGDSPEGSPWNPPKQDFTLFTTRLERMRRVLDGMDEQDLRVLHARVSSQLTGGVTLDSQETNPPSGRNGWVVDFSPLLTSLLGVNTNLLHLGSKEQSKGALFYIGPYINKDGVKINDALPLLLQAHEHALNHASVADDSGTNKRFAQHVLTRTLNCMNSMIEVSDTQGAAAVLGLGASLCSESFVSCNASEYEKHVLKETPAHSDGQETDSESEEGEDEDADWLPPSAKENGSFTESDSDSECDARITADDSVDQNCGLDDKEETMADNEDKAPGVVDRNGAQIAPNQGPSVSVEDGFDYIGTTSDTAPIYTKNDGIRRPVRHAELYRHRGKNLGCMNRHEYISTVQVQRNASKGDNNETSQCNRQFQFGVGLGMDAYYHQGVRSKLCTLKFTRSPPPPPARRVHPPSGSGEGDHGSDCQSEHAHVQLQKKANKFGRHHLIMFRPERKLRHKRRKDQCYKYNWEEFVTFATSLTRDRSMIANSRRTQMDSIISGWRIDPDRRDALASYRGRSRTMWTDEQKEVNKSHFGRWNPSANDDGMDLAAGVPSEFTFKERTDTQKHVKHSNELLGHFEMLVANSQRLHDQRRTVGDSTVSSNEADSGASSAANVATLPYDERLSSAKRDENFRKADEDNVGGDDSDCDEESVDPAHRRMHRRRQRTLADATEKKVDDYIKRQKLSSDKDVPVNIMREHCKAMYEGRAEDDDYKAPFLLICGKPGNGKSKLVETFDGVTERMNSGVNVKCAYMGSAAVNINGTTLLKLWDIPVFKDKQTKDFGPWNPQKLQRLKTLLGGDIHRICCIVLDEVSTVQPYMLACLNVRLQEMFQNNKLWGGRAVVLLGDFDQKPPTAGGKANTLPGSVMEPLERGHSTTRETTRKLGPAHMGGWLLSRARYIKLTSQHRASGDAAHTALLNKMSDTGHIGPWKTSSTTNNYQAKILPVTTFVLPP